MYICTVAVKRIPPLDEKILVYIQSVSLRQLTLTRLARNKNGGLNDFPAGRVREIVLPSTLRPKKKIHLFTKQISIFFFFWHNPFLFGCALPRRLIILQELLNDNLLVAVIQKTLYENVCIIN